MEFKWVINNRRTIRDFSYQKVPDSVISEAIELAFKAPTYDHLRNWHFIIVKDSSTKLLLTGTEEMHESLSEGFKESLGDYEDVAKEMYFEAIPKQKRMIITAPTVVVVCFKPKIPIPQAQRIHDINCVASAWCCIENFLLSLAENNVFGVTFIPKNTERVRDVLDIPVEYEVAAIIPLGYGISGSKAVKQKEIDIHSRIHEGKW